jgi:hypothetical protein
MARRRRLVDGSTIKVRYGGVDSGGVDVIGGSNNNGPPAAAPLSPLLLSWIEVVVDARAYMSELRREVRRLCNDLETMMLTREEEVRRDLLAYIQPLPKVELQRLTGMMSPEVLQAMKGLLLAALSGIGKGVGKCVDCVCVDLASRGRGLFVNNQGYQVPRLVPPPPPRHLINKLKGSTESHYCIL